MPYILVAFVYTHKLVTDVLKIHDNRLMLYYIETDKLGYYTAVNEPVHEISNNVVCATSKASDQPAHTHSLIRAFASRSSIK